MRMQCPCCGEQFPFEAGFADAEGKQLAALFAGLEPKLGRAVLSYLRLFSPAKRGLRTTRAIRLVEELLAMVGTSTVSRDARTNETKPAPPRLWAAGIEQMLVQRDRLQLPLENHNYLRAVVWGIAADPAQAQAAAPAKPPRAATTPQQALQDAIGRIDADVRLGIINKEEGERRVAALRGN
ncbi:hypothetical protein [Pseudomonas sp.]|uniref:hypothetical protein n=1 Tax=Pseudomonas sp. TaxID=306 RepID=UPI0027334EC1|nr:hypothetical protein [Pseudomonas sp.]MDP3816214.1 hypothetical protein [Pseudomonas sp.]